MKAMPLLGVCLATGLIAGIAGIGRAEPPTAKGEGKLRVGVFDSRALAIAYAGSKQHQAHVEQLLRQRNQAETAGDKAKLQQLEFEGQAGQDLLHEQGFSIAPVNNILDTIQDQLPAIAKEARVAMIVSKWEVTYQDTSVELVDVTALLIKPFEPKAKAQQNIDQIQKQAPMPILEIKRLERTPGSKL
jgi:hypothetical protein